VEGCFVLKHIKDNTPGAGVELFDFYRDHWSVEASDTKEHMIATIDEYVNSQSKNYGKFIDFVYDTYRPGEFLTPLMPGLTMPPLSGFTHPADYSTVSNINNTSSGIGYTAFKRNTLSHLARHVHASKRQSNGQSTTPPLPTTTRPLYLTEPSVARRSTAPVKRVAESDPQTGLGSVPVKSKRVSTGAAAARGNKSVLDPMTEGDVVMAETDILESGTSTDKDSVKKGGAVVRKAYARSLTTSSNVQQTGKSVTVTSGSAAVKEPE
jgi:hypothetical protein